jgi:hypothetical protein
MFKSQNTGSIAFVQGQHTSINRMRFVLSSNVMKNPNVLAQKKRERKSSETELISWTDSRLDGSLIIRHLHLSQFHQWTETAKIRWPQQSSDRSKNAIKSSTNEDKSI